MAELFGVALRSDPKQLFTIVVTWNLTALWRRLKKLQSPWAPYLPNRDLISDLPKNLSLKMSERTEDYLKPTSYINPYAPEIIALAVKLGMQEKSKRQFARDAFDWVKNEIYTRMDLPPGDAVDVLRKGYGLCLNKMAVLAALTRLAGIPTRFLYYKLSLAGGGMLQAMVDPSILGGMAQVIEENDVAFTHGCIELLLDEKWMPMDLTFTDEEEAGMDLPISQFGESPFGMWYSALPDSLNSAETLPIGMVGSRMKLGVFLLRGLFDHVVERFETVRDVGRTKLEEMGREEYIESKKKFYVPPPQLKE
jgi:hypothetical protein